MHADIDISAETDRWICSGPSGALFSLRGVIAEYSREGGRRGTFNRDIPIRISLLLFDRQDRSIGHYDNNFPVSRPYGIAIHISLNSSAFAPLHAPLLSSSRARRDYLEAEGKKDILGEHLLSRNCQELPLIWPVRSESSLKCFLNVSRELSRRKSVRIRAYFGHI